MADNANISLSEAVTSFLGTLQPEKSNESQQELSKLVRWYGGDRKISEITALDIEHYSESLTTTLINPEKTLEAIRKFLIFAKKQKMITVSLASHVRISKGKQGRSSKKGVEVESVVLTPEGYVRLEEELEQLKAQRPAIAEQIRLAAADKDVRENAPLEAARELQGQIEARIRDVETTLKGATLVENQTKSSFGIGVGCTVNLCDVDSGEQLCYKLVSPSEANPLEGKISIASPTGKALLDKEVGTVIKVDAPAGMMQYRIEAIKD